MPPIPDHPCGERFCRKCDKFLPLGSFPNGQRRYVCRLHYTQAAKPGGGIAKKHSSSRRPKTIEPSVRVASQNVWHAAYTDAMKQFGFSGVALTQPEMRELFREEGIEIDRAYRVIPVDPYKPLRPWNARYKPSTPYRKKGDSDNFGRGWS
jgi:hypothetical protein